MGQKAGEQSLSWRWWLAIGLIALVFRGGALWLGRANLEQDPQGYRELTEGLINRTMYGRRTMLAQAITPYEQTAYRAPLYPMLLANAVQQGKLATQNVALTHLLLGMATVGLTMHLACCWGMSRAAPWVGLLLAVDPLSLWQSTFLVTFTLEGFLVVATLFALTRLARSPSPMEAALAGILLALCVLCQPKYFVWGIAVLPTLWLLPGHRWLRAVNVGVLAVTFGLVLAPWPVRNWIELGRPICGTTSSSFALAKAHHANRYDHLQNRTRYWQDDDSRRALNREVFREYQRNNRSGLHYELDVESSAYQVALDAMQNQPVLAVQSMGENLLRFWFPLPSRQAQSESTRDTLLRLAVLACSSVTLLLATLGLFQLKSHLWRLPWLWAISLCVLLTLVHTVYWSEAAMRVPLWGVIALLAAAGIERLQARQTFYQTA